MGTVIAGALISAAVSALISAMVALALALILDHFMTWILTAALDVAFSIASGVMDPQSFSYDVAKMFGAGGVLSFPELGSFNILSLFKTIGYSIIIINTVVQILKSLTAAARGERAKSPAQVVVTSLTSVILLVLMFGFGNVNGLIYWIGELMSKAMDWTLNGMGGASGSQNVIEGFNRVLRNTANTNGILEGTWLTGLVSHNVENNQIVQMIFAIAIASGVISAAFSHVERYVTIIIFMLFGPVAIGFGSSDDTKDSSRQWFTGLLAQYLAILLSLVVWRLFFISVAKPWTLFQCAVTLALLSLIRNSEQILNSLGFKTMPSGETARSFLGATAATTGMLKSLGNTIGSFAGGMTGAALGGLAAERNANADLYQARNNASTDRDIKNANAQYRKKTQGLLNGFKGRNPDAAYEKAKAKYGAPRTAMDELKDRKSAIDTATANNIKNAKTQGDIKKALQEREKAYNSLPGAPSAKGSSVFSGVKDAQLKQDALANMDKIGNKRIVDPARSDQYAKEQASLKNAVVGRHADGTDYGSSTFTPNFGGYTQFNGSEDNIKAAQLSNPYLTGDNTNMDVAPLQSTKDFNDMMVGNRDNIPQGTLTEALDLGGMNNPLYDHGTLQGTMSGDFGDCDGYSCGITELAGDNIEATKYAVVPADVVIPEGATFTCNAEDFDAQEYVRGQGDVIVTDSGMQLVPLAEKQTDESNDGYVAESDDVKMSHDNIRDFFADNSSTELTEIDLGGISNVIDDAYEEAVDEQVDSYYDMANDDKKV